MIICHLSNIFTQIYDNHYVFVGIDKVYASSIIFFSIRLPFELIIMTLVKEVEIEVEVKLRGFHRIRLRDVLTHSIYTIVKLAWNVHFVQSDHSIFVFRFREKFKMADQASEREPKMSDSLSDRELNNYYAMVTISARYHHKS